METVQIAPLRWSMFFLIQMHKLPSLRACEVGLYNSHKPVVVTHAGCITAGMGRAFSCVCLFVCLLVCAVKGKWLELSTPYLVHIYSIAVAWHGFRNRVTLIFDLLTSGSILRGQKVTVTRLQKSSWSRSC